MHINTQLSLHSTQWHTHTHTHTHTQWNTSKELETECSDLWNRKPRAWEVNIQRLIEGHSKTVCVYADNGCSDWPRHGTFRLQQPFTQVQNSKDRFGAWRAGRHTKHVWHEYAGCSQTVVYCLNLHQQVKFRPALTRIKPNEFNLLN